MELFNVFVSGFFFVLVIVLAGPQQRGKREAHDFFQILQRKSRFYSVDAHCLLAKSWSPLEAEEMVDLTTSDRLLGQRHRIFKVVGLPPIDEL